MYRLNGKKNVCEMWEKVHLGGHRNVFRDSRDSILFELNLEKEVKDNKKGYLKNINNERKTRENVSLLLNELDTLLSEDTEETDTECLLYFSL